MYRVIAISFLLLFGTFENSKGQTHVQTTTLFQTTTASNIAKAFTASSTSGNLIVVHIDWDGQSRSITSVTDSKGNSYARINGPTNWNGVNYRAELWYAYNINGGGPAITVTAHLSGAPTSFSQIYISEYSGIVPGNPLDQNSVAIGNSLAVSSGSKTIVYDNELVYGASIGASGTLTVGGGFTSRSTANSNIIEDKKAVTIGAYNAGFTSAGGNWVAQMATFVSTSSSILLPVDLLSFTGQCNNSSTVLEWSTASETNSDYFSIERSEDGNNWKTIGNVKSAGNSSSIQKYSFDVEENKGEISYFRLKQTDLNGKSRYFNIIRVNNCSGNLPDIHIYPNPTNGITLSGIINLKAYEEYTIVVFDKVGNIINRSTSRQSKFTVHFPQILSTGIYYARFYSSSFSKSVIFLVNH